MSEGDKLDIGHSEEPSPDPASRIRPDLLKEKGPARPTEHLKGTNPQEELDRELAEQNIYGGNERITVAQLEKRASKDSDGKTEAGKYLPDKLSDERFEKLKDLKKTREELETIRHEINTFGEDPEEAIVNLMKTNRVVGVADGMHAPGGGQRPLGARVMDKMKAAGATHFAIEASPSIQSALDDYMKTGKLQIDKLPPGLQGDDFVAMLESARKAGLTIVAADPRQDITKGGDLREKGMAGAIGNILDASSTNKVFWWVGDNHLRVPPNAKNAPGNLRAAAFLRQKYKIATVGQEQPDIATGSLSDLASDVKDRVAISTVKAKELAKLPTSAYLGELLSDYYGNFDYIVLHPMKKEH